MRPKSLILLMLALGCGLVASIGISQVMDRRGSGNATIETEAIYIAKDDINVSEPITAEMVKLDEWPKAKLPAGSMKSLDNLLERRPRTKIYAGEPILEKKLRAKNTEDDPSQQIPNGYRVVPVLVGSDAGGTGLIGPGDRVDVQLFVKRKQVSGIAQTMVKTILTNIRVFAVNKQFRRSSDSGDDRVVAKTVSLLATPEQANKLTLASKLGQIKMIIRNPDDTTVDTTGGTTIAELFGTSQGDRDKERSPAKQPKAKSPFGEWLARAQAAALLASAQRPPWTVEVLQGTQRTEVLFDEHGRRIRHSRKAFSSQPISPPPVSEVKPAKAPDKPAKADDTANDSYGNATESDGTDNGKVTVDDLILPEDPPVKD